jgi:hypothetical protein
MIPFWDIGGLLKALNIADVVLGTIVLLLAWSFYSAQKDVTNVFNLFDLIMENGRVSKVAVAFMATLGVTSWIMVRLAIDGKLTEGYFTGYGLMWVAPIIAKMFNPNPSGTTTTVTATTETIDKDSK